MNERPIPRRIRRLDALYREQGGIRAYVLRKYDEGFRVEDIAVELSTHLEKSISAWTLRLWLRRWRQEGGDVSNPTKETAAA